jgi:hypothetical protein
LILQRFAPNLHVRSVYDIDLNALKGQGVKGIIVDLDNTLVASNEPDATPEVVNWMSQVKNLGFQLVIVSNNSKSRVVRFAQPLEIPFIFKAKKPLRFAFSEVLNRLGLAKKEVVVVGDQLLTDVLGGNLMGLYTVLVIPVSKTEGIGTKINRRFERVLMSWLKRKGYLTWEEKS